MFEKNLVVNNTTGLHARPAAMLVQVCSKFESETRLLVDGKSVNAKSIIGILSCGINQGTEVTLQVEGKDEAEAGKAIVELINGLKE
jgi:phosphotransferase system HPr (HPr) family protein